MSTLCLQNYEPVKFFSDLYGLGVSDEADLQLKYL